MDIIKKGKIDISTLSNIEQIHQTKISFSLEIDFNNKIMFGSTTIDFLAVTDNVSHVTLDSKNLEVSRVTRDSKELNFSIDKSKGDNYPLGTPLQIELNSSLNINEKISLRIELSTTTRSEAIQWLSKEQTKGKNHPFVFTQCEAILARSLLPCQDSPSIKCKVHALLKVQEPLTGLYSGILKTKSSKDGYNTFEYIQDVPVPAYLICIAAGNLEFRKLSQRCGVWSEPELAEMSQNEFEDTEVFLKTAETYLTPYEWGTYDILVLPPGFAYGGMENPNLTFVTPSLLAGDKSLVNVIAHEITHSWTGNLVTNNNWQNFWVNEGFTMFVERKILELVYGRDMFLVEAYEGYQQLVKTVDQIGKDHSFTSLTPELSDIDPDDAFSIIPYEKGFLFLYFLETLVGAEIFQKVLQTYITTYRLKSVNYTEFKAVFETQIENLLGKEKADQVNKEIDWNHWVHQCNSLIDISNELARQFINGQAPKNSKEIFNSLHSSVKSIFFYKIFEQQISEDVYVQLRDNLDLNDKLNDDLASVWYQFALKSRINDVIPYVQNYLSRVGRMKYLRPIYKLLYTLDSEVARKTFESNKQMYFPVAVRLIENDFKQLSK